MSNDQVKLSHEEKELLDSVESGEWASSKTPEKSFYEKSAKKTLRKDARLNIRISSRDILAVKAKAAKEGIPYQTLISSIIHKFASGRLKEKKA